MYFLLSRISTRSLGVVLLLCCLACALGVSATASTCEDTTQPTNWRFIGGGFHMKLEVDYPVVSDNVSVEFDLLRAFFIDAAEALQQYRMWAVNTSGPSVELTSSYRPLALTSDHFFDIEAPVFKVNYSANHVLMSFTVAPERVGHVRAMADAGLTRAILEIPIHARYEELNTELPFQLSRFLGDDGAYVERCLEDVLLTWQSTSCGEGTTSASRSAPGHCVSIPVGVLSSLPFVYHTLMGLLVFGALIVVVSI